MVSDSKKDNDLENSQKAKDDVSVDSSARGSVVENEAKEQVELSNTKMEGDPGSKVPTEEPQAQTEGLDQVKESSLQASDQTAKKQEQTTSKDLEDEAATVEEEKIAKESLPEVYLNGLYAIKLGMSSVYSAQGQMLPVTVLRFDTWKVTQIKTKEKDGYTAIQLGSKPKSERKSNLPQKGHLKPSGFQTNVTFLHEIRGEVPAQPSEKNEKEAASQDAKNNESMHHCQLGQVLSIHSLVKGDRVHLSAISKGRGFAGTIKRFGYSGGPASHGSQFHRKPGSIGMCEEPARVLPGKGMPGHHGNRNATLKHVEIVDVIPEKKVLLVKGSVPGGRNSLVKLMKEGV